MGIKGRLRERINDIESFLMYWKRNQEEIRKCDCIGIGTAMEKYSTYLNVLKAIITGEYRVREIEPTKIMFGLEVFLFELDELYNEGIAPFKVELDSFISSKGKGYRNVTTTLTKLGSLVNNSSFIKIMNDEEKAVSVTKKYITGVRTDFPESRLTTLRDYLDVGRTLVNDPIMKMIIEQVKSIHESAVASNEIAMYSAIIGPNFMGKTQTAFTLSCMINVIYINFASVFFSHELLSPQKIYTLFEGISKLFVMVVQEDDAKFESQGMATTAQSIENSELSFRTLGLIYLLIRTRKIRESQSLFSINDWFLELVHINSAIIPEMRIQQFRKKSRDIDLSQLSVFMDGLPRNDENISSIVMIIRNLCRIAKIPSFITGTNSSVANMTGPPVPRPSHQPRGEGNESKSWVKLVVKTAKASLQSIAKLVKFKKHGETSPSGCLTSFLSTTNLNAIDYAGLFDAVCGPDKYSERLFGCFVKLVKFLILQAETSLPGIIALVFNILLELLPGHSDPRKLWSELANKFTKSVLLKKGEISGKDGLMATSHILTSPCAKHEIKEGAYSANLVQDHLFYYGTRQDVSFQLNIKYEKRYGSLKERKIILVRDNSKYIDKCYFPELNEDFFTNFASLNAWNISVFNRDAQYLDRWTMASLYESYLNMYHEDAQSSLLTYWSICHASHLDFNGQTDGVTFFWEFIKNLQKSKDSSGEVRTITFPDSNIMHDNLKAILEKVKMPYMLRFPDANTRMSLNNFIGDFMETGESSFEQFGWDVAFEMKFNGEGRSGLMECKYHDKAIGYAGFYDYYKKHCEIRPTHPIAFFICRKLGNQISSIDAGKKLLESNDEKSVDPGEPDEDEELYDPEEMGSVKRVIRDYPAMLNELWLKPGNEIDIYTVKYKELEESDDNIGVFTISALKTFAAPRGAFILVESNFTT